VLNRFRVTTATGDATPEPVKLVRAAASFSQARYSVENLLKPDDDGRGGWAIAPQFGREHWATFETAQPLGAEAGTTFTFTLVQNFGTGRTIGRLRLSALTGSVGGPKIPADVAAILRTPAAMRTPQQATKLDEYFLAQDPASEELRLARVKVEQELNAIRAPQTLVMQELPEPRPTFVLNRGNFLDPAERVDPARQPSCMP
jgi:hypothetical protein